MSSIEQIRAEQEARRLGYEDYQRNLDARAQKMYDSLVYLTVLGPTLSPVQWTNSLDKLIAFNNSGIGNIPQRLQGPWRVQAMLLVPVTRAKALTPEQTAAAKSALAWARNVAPPMFMLDMAEIKYNELI